MGKRRRPFENANRHVHPAVSSIHLATSARFRELRPAYKTCTSQLMKTIRRSRGASYSISRSIVRFATTTDPQRACSRHGSSVIQDAKKAELSFGVPRKVADGGGDVLGAAKTQEGQAQVVQHGQIMPCVPKLFATIVFAQSDIAEPMLAFDRPVSAM